MDVDAVYSPTHSISVAIGMSVDENVALAVIFWGMSMDPCIFG